MQPKPSTTAQRLLNLYRQQHVIFGGWDAVNRIFMADADNDVLVELRQLPAGRMLAQHIENLRSGKTQIDSIAPELLPYGGLMTESVASTNLSKLEMAELRAGIEGFVPDSDGLARLQSLGVVKKFGDEWLVALRAPLGSEPELLNKWNVVVKTARAYYLWKVAKDILGAPLSDRARAQVQADLPEYETYLPMFGDAGKEVLSKLRTFVSSF